MYRFLLLCMAFSSLPACGIKPRDYPSGIRYDLSCPCLPRRAASGLAFDPDYLWPASPVNVCFDNGSEEQKEWVRDAISNTWGLASRLRLSWLPCGEDGFQEVHIGFGKSLSVAGIGVQLNRLPGGLILGTFRNDERDLRMQAVFAFGFAMGFAAGQDRGDSPCERPVRFPGFAVRQLGPWDEMSTMNECRAPTYNLGLLSEGDMAGAQLVYGERDVCDCP